MPYASFPLPPPPVPYGLEYCCLSAFLRLACTPSPPPPPTPRHASCARVLSIGTGRRHHTARQVNRPGPTGLHPAPHPHQQPPRRLWSPVVGELHPPTSLLQPSLPGRPGDLLLQLVSGWMGEWVHGALPAVSTVLARMYGLFVWHGNSSHFTVSHRVASTLLCPLLLLPFAAGVFYAVGLLSLRLQ